MDDSLGAFANLLNSTQRDMTQATPHPTTPLEKDYQFNYKVKVAQLSEAWDLMAPGLISQGIPNQDVFRIGAGLQIIYMNILPPRPSDQRSVQLAMEWITYFNDSMYPDDKAPQSNDVFLPRLKSRLPAILDKYKSFKSDADFAVQSLFVGVH